MKGSGKVQGETNRKAFEAFIHNRLEHNDWEYYISSNRKRLVKTYIAANCGMSRSSFKSNPGLIQMLITLEATLRDKGILMGENVLASTCQERVERIDATTKRIDEFCSGTNIFKDWLIEIEVEVAKI